MWLRKLWKSIRPITSVTKSSDGLVECARFGVVNLQVNSSVCLFRLGDTVIDTGAPNRWKDGIKKYLQQAASDEEDLPVKQVLVTHHHEDHGGNGKAIRDELGIPVYAMERAVRFLQEHFYIHPYRRIIWGSPQPYTPLVLSEKGTTATVMENGEKIVLTVLPVYAPGHSSDHYVYWVPEKKWLFSADLYVATKQTTARYDEDIIEQMESIGNIVKNLDVQTIFCAHKGIVEENASSLLQTKYNNIREMQKKVLRIYTDDPSLQTKPEDIKKQVFGREELTWLVSQGHFSRIHLIKQLLAPYSHYKEAQKNIGAISPEHALRYLESGSIRGPGAEPATLLSNESWLEKHQLRIDHAAADKDMANTPGMGQDSLGDSGEAENASQELMNVMSSSRVEASARRAKMLSELGPQEDASHFTIRDAEQTVRSAHAQHAVFPQEERQPTWIAKQFGESSPQQRVLMPDLSMQTPVEALISMRNLNQRQNELRSEALQIARNAADKGEHVAAITPSAEHRKRIGDNKKEKSSGGKGR